VNEFWHGVVVGVFLTAATQGVAFLMFGVWLKAREREEDSKDD